MIKLFVLLCGMGLGLQAKHFDWRTIDVDDLEFPKNFLWGTATAAHQVEGHCVNNWSSWEDKRYHNGKPTVLDNTRSGASCDHWNLYEEDIALMKELGVNSYRFSVEWSKIEPQEGVFDQDALAHYEAVCDALMKAGIEPMVTLHHFTHPLWFEEKGAFENEENISYFVRFSTRVFDVLSSKVKFWCTVNEPNTCSFQGYCTGMFTPGIKDPHHALVVMKNMAEAHVQVYHALKKRDGGEDACIGLAHNISQFKAYNRWNPVTQTFCAVADHCFNTLIIEFLKTGVFSYTIPGFVRVHHVNPAAIDALDYIGLNYYSELVFDLQCNAQEPIVPRYHEDAIMTDLPYPLYADGLYDAIERVALLNKPIYITENGIADHSDDRRALFIRRYLYVLSQALRDGFDIRGYFYWSLMDNFEWCLGFEPKFGLYHVDFDTQKRTLRPGSQALVSIIKRFSV